MGIIIIRIIHKMKLFVALIGTVLSCLAQANVPSECEKPCTMHIEPICGNDGATYTNLCMFKNAECEMKSKGLKLAFAYDGECVHNSKVCKNACPRNYDPVCVLNGEEEVTFPNECEFKKEVCNSHRTDLIVLRHSACQHEHLNFDESSHLANS